MSLYHKHRPTSFKGVIGQPVAVSTLKEMVDNNRVPHALLFIGDSGCGKTTLARILGIKLECNGSDFVEKNAADFRGIEMVRDLRQQMNLHPLGGGKCRIYLIDECHQLSKDAQNALLKMLEDTPAHVYFMLATTDPMKLLTTIRTRCTEVKCKAMSPAAQKELLQLVADKEGVELSDEVIDRITEHAEGSARKALVLLDQVYKIEGAPGQLEAIESSSHKSAAIDLARAIMSARPWKEVSELITSIDEEPEALRRMMLGYAASVLLKGGKMAPRAFLLLDVFSRPFYDTGKPGLVCACYAVSTK